MKIVEVEKLTNGAHRNQTYNGFMPEGWALLRPEMETENFPFGEITVQEKNGVLTVVTWEALPMPGPEPEPAPDLEPSSGIEQQVSDLQRQVDEMSAAISRGLSL